MVLADVLPTVPDQLLGPYGLLVAALLAVGFLARELFKFIRELLTSKDLIIADQRIQISTLLKVVQDQTDANKVLADAQASRNRDDEMRHRLEDAKASAPSRTRQRT